MKKSIKVHTNDPKNEQITLELSGKIKTFVKITPSKVFLKGTVGESISGLVTIVPGEGETFEILQANALKGGDFKFELKDIEIDGKKAYELWVENIRETEGRYFDKIFLITDRTDQAPLSVIVSGYIEKPKDSGAKPETTEPAPDAEPEPSAQ